MPLLRPGKAPAGHVSIFIHVAHLARVVSLSRVWWLGDSGY